MKGKGKGKRRGKGKGKERWGDIEWDEEVEMNKTVEILLK